MLGPKVQRGVIASEELSEGGCGQSAHVTGFSTSLYAAGPGFEPKFSGPKSFPHEYTGSPDLWGQEKKKQQLTLIESCKPSTIP